MSQSDSGTSIIELAKEAGARKLLLKKMVLQCIEERGMTTESGRLERQVSLRKLAPSVPSSVPAAFVPARPATLAPEIESRLASLEAVFQRLGIAESLQQTSLEGFAARVHAIDQKIEVLRSDLRNLDLSGARISEQVNSFDQIFASLGRDARKLSHTVDALAIEIRKPHAQIEDARALQERLTYLESGMARSIDLLQSPAHGLADLSQMRDRFLEMEVGLEQVKRAVADLQSPPEDAEVLAEREATAKVLASLTKLVERMRSSDRHQVGLGDSRI